MSAVMNTKLEPFAWVDWMISEREKQRMSQADLARKTGLTRTTISDYEKRIRPNPATDTLVRISTALGYPPEYLPRLAGVLPPEPGGDPWIDKMSHKLRSLSPGRHSIAERFIDSLIEEDQANENTKSRPKPKTKSAKA